MKELVIEMMVRAKLECSTTNLLQIGASKADYDHVVSQPLFKAIELAEHQDWANAYIACMSVLKKTNHEPEIWQILSKIYEHQKDTKKAILCVQKAVKYEQRLNRIG